MGKKRMCLHEAIIQVLREKGEAMSYEEIAERVGEQELYVRPSDGLPAPPYQVRLRTYVSKKYKHLFTVNDIKGIVGLAEWSEVSE